MPFPFPSKGSRVRVPQSAPLLPPKVTESSEKSQGFRDLGVTPSLRENPRRTPVYPVEGATQGATSKYTRAPWAGSPELVLLCCEATHPVLGAQRAAKPQPLHTLVGSIPALFGGLVAVASVRLRYGSDFTSGRTFVLALPPDLTPSHEGREKDAHLYPAGTTTRVHRGMANRTSMGCPGSYTLGLGLIQSGQAKPSQPGKALLQAHAMARLPFFGGER